MTAYPGGRTASGSASPIVVTGLTNGIAYQFTVIATNANGDGPASGFSDPVTPSGPSLPPGPPTNVVATPGNDQATVTFTAPASNGGSSIIAYTVTADTGGQTASGTVGPITVAGLTNGTAYTFTVAATNAAGTGPASAPSNAITPAAGGPATAVPSRVIVTAGTLQSGNASSLGTADTNYLSVMANDAVTHKAAWYGEIPNVPNTITSLSVSYRGNSSSSCKQTISIRDFTNLVWVKLDGARPVGTTDGSVNLTVMGPLANYVSGITGDGKVRIQVSCTSAADVFTSDENLLNLTYSTP